MKGNDVLVRKMFAMLLSFKHAMWYGDIVRLLGLVSAQTFRGHKLMCSFRISGFVDPAYWSSHHKKYSVSLSKRDLFWIKECKKYVISFTKQKHCSGCVRILARLNTLHSPGIIQL